MVADVRAASVNIFPHIIIIPLQPCRKRFDCLIGRYGRSCTAEATADPQDSARAG